MQYGEARGEWIVEGAYHQVVDYVTGTVANISAKQIHHWILSAQQMTDQRIYSHDSIFYEKDFDPSPEDIKKANRRRMREVIKSRHFPGIVIKPTRKPLPPPPDLREQAARETLRRVIGEDQWKRFVRTGFIQVRAKSGRYYQIFPGHGMTKVFENGEYVAKLCIVLTTDFPATDSIIMRYLILLNNEEEFWRRSVKHYIKSQHEVEDLWPNFVIPPSPDMKTAPLTEIARHMKAAS